MIKVDIATRSAERTSQIDRIYFQDALSSPNRTTLIQHLDKSNSTCQPQNLVSPARSVAAGIDVAEIGEPAVAT
jgi:hypothetical protein